MTTSNYRITGRDCIRLAERDGITIRCYANPIDDGGPVTVGVALQIARDDANLLYADVAPRGWTGGDATGANISDYFSPSGMYLGPDDDGVEPTWGDAH